MYMKMLLPCLLFSFLLAVNGQEVVEVTTQHGTIRGQVVSTPFATELDQFLGIPYAVPPIGSRRFANPEFYGDFPGGIFEAFENGYECPQAETFLNSSNTGESEDCLYLNVWRPRPTEQNKAVMVWIHGGGFVTGSGDHFMFHEETLASYGDVILVSINYRLGVFGFFYTGDDRMDNGNLGLLDQQMALQWVQENIAAFGGDPKQVTIFGESAGSSSVCHHMTLEGAGGLFNRVIAQSGSSTAYWSTITSEIAAALTEQLANQTACSNDDSLLSCLRDIPTFALLDTAFNMGYIATPVIDGTTLLDHPLSLISSGQVQRRDVLIGFNKDEASLFIYDVIPNLTEEAIEADPYGSFVYSATYLARSIRNLTDEQTDVVIAAYEPSNITDVTATKISISDMVGDLMFVCASEELALGVNEQGIKVYEYFLTYRASTSPFNEWHGVVHAADLQWVFGSPFSRIDIPYDELEEYFSAEIMDIWIDFAKYGFINDDWNPYNSEGAFYAEFRGPGDFRYFSGAVREERCSTWLYSYQ